MARCKTICKNPKCRAEIYFSRTLINDPPDYCSKCIAMFHAREIIEPLGVPGQYLVRNDIKKIKEENSKEAKKEQEKKEIVKETEKITPLSGSGKITKQKPTSSNW